MKNKLITGIASVAICAGFASCSHHDFEPMTQAEIDQANYEAAFIKRFGQPDPNHTWGFGTTTRATRAVWEGTVDNGIGVNTEANNWWKTMKLPDPITKEEQTKVYNVFANTKVSNVKNPNWERFFVQQVWQGNNTYTATKTDGSEVKVEGWKMNQLMCGKTKETMGHINNGNDAKITATTVHVAKQGAAYAPNNGEPRQPKQNELEEGIMLVCNGGTGCFGFHSSESTEGSGYYTNYLLLEIDGAYYVGFDFETGKPGEGWHLDPDGVYTDWIVKICPADYYKTPVWNGAAKRIFCEDLGNTDDLDFNDVVLDVVNENNNKTIITLRAAGGTLRAHIIANGQDLGEVHELFGVEQKNMVNTRTNGSVNRPIVVLEVDGQLTPGDVQIQVEGKNGEIYSLTATKGKVPYKFATDLGVDWADERQQINEKYPNFEVWVGDENQPFWK